MSIQAHVPFYGNTPGGRGLYKIKKRVEKQVLTESQCWSTWKPSLRNDAIEVISAMIDQMFNDV